MGTSTETNQPSAQTEERPTPDTGTGPTVRYVYQILDADTGTRSAALAGNLEEMYTFLEKATTRLNAERLAAKEQDLEEQGEQYVIILSESMGEDNKFSSLPILNMESMFQLIGEKLNAA